MAQLLLLMLKDMLQAKYMGSKMFMVYTGKIGNDHLPQPTRQNLKQKPIKEMSQNVENSSGKKMKT